MNYYLRSQDELLSELEAFARDPNNTRWSDAEMYRTINRALLGWYERVGIQWMTTLSGGLVTGTWTYAIPDYITEPIYLEQRDYRYPTLNLVLSDSTSTFIDVPHYHMEADGSGGMQVRMDIDPQTTDAQFRWYIRNGPIPVTIPTVNTEINSTATSVILDLTTDVAKAGWIKIGTEWIFYAGVTRGASTTTLSNLLRGQYNSTAATHTATTNVYWGCAVHRMDLWDALHAAVMKQMHAMFLTNASAQEQELHRDMIGYYNQQELDFWRRYTNPIQARFTGIRLTSNLAA